jgi:hypothetical protein
MRRRRHAAILAARRGPPLEMDHRRGDSAAPDAKRPAAAPGVLQGDCVPIEEQAERRPAV